jgi:hypothetical protein
VCRYDLDAVSKEVELYRDKWVMPLRDDEPVDFANRDVMLAECKTWTKPFVKVPKVDVKEGETAAAASAAADTSAAAAADATDKAETSSSSSAAPAAAPAAAAAAGETSSASAPAAAAATAAPVASAPAEAAELTPELLGMYFKVGKVLSAGLHAVNPLDP